MPSQSATAVLSLVSSTSHFAFRPDLEKNAADLHAGQQGGKACRNAVAGRAQGSSGWVAFAWGDASCMENALYWQDQRTLRACRPQPAEKFHDQSKSSEEKKYS
jgi:hypothetical protein